MSVSDKLRGLAHTLEAITSECGEFKTEWRRRQDESVLPCRWLGQWRSDANGHHGELRCILKSSGEKSLVAFFRAKYGRILRACYKVELSITAIGQRYGITGKTDLGALAGGVYHYEGYFTHAEFRCRYRCKYDEGDFNLLPVTETQV